MAYYPDGKQEALLAQVYSLSVRASVLARERQSDRETERQVDRDRDRDKQREAEEKQRRERERERERKRERERERERESTRQEGVVYLGEAKATITATACSPLACRMWRENNAKLLS
jgi:hypothetical protein